MHRVTVIEVRMGPTNSTIIDLGAGVVVVSHRLSHGLSTTHVDRARPIYNTKEHDKTIQTIQFPKPDPLSLV